MIHRIGKRVLALCAALALMLGCIAASAESNLAVLWNTGLTLLTATDNVTLQGTASFSYDGQRFKTLTAAYRQAGYNSWTDLVYTTYRKDITQETGWTLLNRNTSTEIYDRYYGAYDRTASDAVNTVLSDSSSAILKTAGSAALTLLDAVTGGSFAEAQTQEDGSAVYTVKADAQSIPAAFQNVFREAVIDLAPNLIGRFLYTYEPEPYNRVIFDYDTLFPTVYKQLFGTDMPEGFYERSQNDGASLSEAEWQEYGEVYGRITAMDNYLTYQYADGVTVIRADGSVKHYDSGLDYQRAEQPALIYWEDTTASAAQLYNEKNGTALRVDEFWYSLCDADGGMTEEGSELFDSLVTELTEKYQALGEEDPEAVAVLVYADGTHKLCKSMSDAEVALAGISSSMANAIQSVTQTFALGAADLQVGLDAEGRITALSGTVTLDLTDYDRQHHELVITLDCTAADYGTTTLADVEAAFEKDKAERGY